MKIAFLFGAGASFGAGGVRPEPPPLGGALYDRLRKEFPETWGKLIQPDEDAAFRVEPPFEQGMSMLWQKGDARAQLLITDLALFFCRFSLGPGPDAYSRLLAILQGRRIQAAFATLNCDCLFEVALLRTGSAVNYLLSANGGGGVPVMKPHGSCNFVAGGLGQGLQITNVTMSGSANYYEGPLMALPPEQVASLYSQGPSIPPAISLFAPGKDSPVSRNEIERIRAHWRNSVAEADVIVVVGARPVLADSHVWDPILASRAHVWHLGGTSGRDYETYQNLLGQRLTTLAPRFDEGLSRLDTRLQILG